MKRRDFVTLLGGAAATWPLAARAQQSGGEIADHRLSRLGLGLGWDSHGRPPLYSGCANSAGSKAGPWRSGAAGQAATIERVADIAADFVRLNVAVIVTYANTAAGATKRAVADIPIVFAAAGDPVRRRARLFPGAAGRGHPGLSIQQTDLAGKRLELLRELLPGLHTLAILANTGSPNAVLEMDEAQEAARRLGLAVIRSDVRRTGDFAPALDTLKGRAEALYLCSDPLLTTNRLEINTLAIEGRGCRPCTAFANSPKPEV